jgi:hypothetical protein
VSRFDYVAWDENSQKQSDGFKKQCLELEEYIAGSFSDSREKSMAITKLEELFMWIGKAIRTDQLKRSERA